MGSEGVAAGAGSTTGEGAGESLKVGKEGTPKEEGITPLSN